jgi:phage terminase small subunit
MEPPRGLNSAGRQAFAHAVATLEASGDDPALYREAIAMYARASDMAAMLRRAWVARGSPTVATGSRHNPITHPLVREIEAQEKHVAMLAQSLLLTPESRVKAGRARGGRPAGTSQSPDRRLRLARPSD